MPRALERSLERRQSELDVTGDIFDHHDGIIDDEAGRDRQSHQRQIVQAEIRQVHDREGADQGQGHREAGNDGGRDIAQEQINHQHHQHHGERQFEFDVGDGGPDGGRAVGEHGDIHARRHGGLQRRQQIVNPVDHVDHVGSGLALHVHDQGRRRVHPAAEFGVFRARDQRSDIAQPHRRPVLIGDNHTAVILGVADLVVGIDRISAARAVERALRPVLVGVVDGGAQVVEIQAVGGHGARVHHDPNRRALAAADADDAHTFELRDFLGDARIRKILHLGERHHLRGDAQNQHRCIGRIHLGVYRRGRQILRQQILRGADRRLHLLFGHVDGERQVELQRDDRRPTRTRRVHLVQTGHLTELLFQGRGDGGRNDLGARAGIEGLYLDGRIGDLGQRRERQRPVGDGAHDQYRDHQQGRRDRSQDEDARRIHCGVLFCFRGRCGSFGLPPCVPGAFTADAGPAPRRLRQHHLRAVAQPIAAFGDHALAHASPDFTATRSPSTTPSVTGRTVTVWSAFTT